MINIDAIVTGAGIWGCTVARRLAEEGAQGAGEADCSLIDMTR